MGNCSPSELNPASSSSTSSNFDVYNVDARLFKHSKGKMHISSAHLILEHKNASAESIKWPLNGIRRYGYHKDIFLFESGRKCSTGEGLFAFKCDKAKRLNDLLHKAILNNATSLCNLQQTSTQRTFTRSPNNNNSSNDATNLDATSNNTLSIYSERGVSINILIEPKNSSITDGAELSQRDSNISASPYYVNDIQTLVRLPMSLANFGSNSENDGFNNYVNSEQIDPCILHITKKFTSENAKRLCDKVKKSSPIYGLSKVNNSTSVEAPSLNYVIAERVLNNNEKVTAQIGAEPLKLDTMFRLNELKMADNKENEKSRTTEYMSIDLNKTPAIQFSKSQNENKRKEYFLMQKNVSH